MIVSQNEERTIDRAGDAYSEHTTAMSIDNVKRAAIDKGPARRAKRPRKVTRGEARDMRVAMAIASERHGGVTINGVKAEAMSLGPNVMVEMEVPKNGRERKNTVVSSNTVMTKVRTEYGYADYVVCREHTKRTICKGEVSYAKYRTFHVFNGMAEAIEYAEAEESKDSHDLTACQVWCNVKDSYGYPLGRLYPESSFLEDDNGHTQAAWNDKDAEDYDYTKLDDDDDTDDGVEGERYPLAKLSDDRRRAWDAAILWGGHLPLTWDTNDTIGISHLDSLTSYNRYGGGKPQMSKYGNKRD